MNIFIAQKLYKNKGRTIIGRVCKTNNAKHIYVYSRFSKSEDLQGKWKFNWICAIKLIRKHFQIQKIPTKNIKFHKITLYEKFTHDFKSNRKWNNKKKISQVALILYEKSQLPFLIMYSRYRTNEAQECLFPFRLFLSSCSKCHWKVLFLRSSEVN